MTTVTSRGSFFKSPPWLIDPLGSPVGRTNSTVGIYMHLLESSGITLRGSEPLFLSAYFFNLLLIHIALSFSFSLSLSLSPSPMYIYLHASICIWPTQSISRPLFNSKYGLRNPPFDFDEIYCMTKHELKPPNHAVPRSLSCGCCDLRHLRSTQRRDMGHQWTNEIRRFTLG